MNGCLRASLIEMKNNDMGVPLVIKVLGKKRILQSNINGALRYVPLDKFEPAAFAYIVPQPELKALEERMAMEEILDSIMWLEMCGEIASEVYADVERGLTPIGKTP